MTEEKSCERILITGATGYVASHCIKEALNAGYIVRGTVRSLKSKKIGPLKEMFGERIELVETDLTKDDNWNEAVKDCKFVLHTASPVSLEVCAKDPETTFYKPAIEGTLRVLKACEKNIKTVKKVVITSSMCSIICGHDKNKLKNKINETNWTNTDSKHVHHYAISKTKAEKAAWDFVENMKSSKKFELVVFNPGFIVGPIITKNGTTSADIIEKLTNREYPACPKFDFFLIDVRDVALAHILALKNPKTPGNRYILFEENAWMSDIGKTLYDELNQFGYNPPTGDLPYAVLWLISWFDQRTARSLHSIGERLDISNTKVQQDLGIKFRNGMKAIREMSHTMIQNGLVEMKPKYKQWLDKQSKEKEIK